VRTIVWAVISILAAVVAAHGLDVLSRYSARPGVAASVEIEPGPVDDSGDHGDTAPPRHMR
jgi:hypothetical protein